MIEPGNYGYAEDPQVAAGVSGDAFAVWDRHDGTSNNIWANRYVEGTGWGSAQLIEADIGGALKAQVAADGNGNAMAVWHQHDGTRYNIWSNRYVHGTGWGAAQLVETGAGEAREPHLAMETNGNAVAVWFQSDGTRYNIWASEYTPGIGWGTPALIETDDTGDAFSARVSVDGSGNAFAVWQQFDGTRYNIWSNLYAAGIGWGTAALIETDDAGDANFPQVAVSESGTAFAVWYQSDGTWDNAWANRYVPGTGWGTATLIETDNTGDAYGQQVAVDIGGNAIAVWFQSDGVRLNIWSARYTAGTGWGRPRLLETDNTGSAVSPQVAVDRSGNAVAVWTQVNGTRANIWANRYVAAAWGGAQQVENSSGQALFSAVAVDASGNAVAVWYQQGGVGPGIIASRLVEDYPPQLVLGSPLDGANTNVSSVSVSGITEPGALLWVNGVAVSVGPSGSFTVLIPLTPGTNAVNITAVDRAGNRATKALSVRYDDPVPELQQELTAAQAALASSQSELAQVESMLALSEANLSAAQARVATVEANGNATQAELNAARSDLSAAQQTVIALQAAAANSTSAVAAANARISALETNSTASQAPPVRADNTLAILALAIGAGAAAVGLVALVRSGRGPKAPPIAQAAAEPPQKP